MGYDVACRGALGKESHGERAMVSPNTRRHLQVQEDESEAGPDNVFLKHCSRGSSGEMTVRRQALHQPGQQTKAGRKKSADSKPQSGSTRPRVSIAEAPRL